MPRTRPSLRLQIRDIKKFHFEKLFAFFTASHRKTCGMAGLLVVISLIILLCSRGRVSLVIAVTSVSNQTYSGAKLRINKAPFMI